MKKAIKKEEYENASKLRDQIAAIEAGAWADDDASDAISNESESFQADTSLDSTSKAESDSDDTDPPEGR